VITPLSVIGHIDGLIEKGNKKIMNTVERQFPTEEEVDQWMDTHLFGNAEVDGNPELDQLTAAARETTSRWMGAGPSLVAAGHADTFFGGENPNAALRCCAALYESTWPLPVQGSPGYVVTRT
jgi:hypothetical protein